ENDDFVEVHSLTQRHPCCSQIVRGRIASDASIKKIVLRKIGRDSPHKTSFPKDHAFRERIAEYKNSGFRIVERYFPDLPVPKAQTVGHQRVSFPAPGPNAGAVRFQPEDTGDVANGEAPQTPPRYLKRRPVHRCGVEQVKSDKHHYAEGGREQEQHQLAPKLRTLALRSRAHSCGICLNQTHLAPCALLGSKIIQLTVTQAQCANSCKTRDTQWSPRNPISPNANCLEEHKRTATRASLVDFLPGLCQLRSPPERCPSRCSARLRR